MATKQQSLPGVGPKRIAEIEDAALEVRDLQSKRKAITEEEGKARGLLRELLKKNGFKKNKPYQFENEGDGELVKLDVVIEQKEEKAYVRRHKDPKDDSDADEADEKAEEGDND